MKDSLNLIKAHMGENIINSNDSNIVNSKKKSRKGEYKATEGEDDEEEDDDKLEEKIKQFIKEKFEKD